MSSHGSTGPGLIEIKISVSEFRRAAQAIAMANAKGTYRGMFRDEIRRQLGIYRDYAASITHKGSGQLAGAHMFEYDSHRMQGWVFINPRAVWHTGATVRWPKVYGIYEHNRGGSHAFYERTIREKVPGEALSGLYLAVRSLPWP